MPRRRNSARRARSYTFSRNPAPRLFETSKTAPMIFRVKASIESAFIGVHRRPISKCVIGSAALQSFISHRLTFQASFLGRCESTYKMKIGITCYPTYGGSGIVATELGLELANRGHEIHFITYANPIRLDPGTPRIHYHEVEVSNYPLFQYPPYCLSLAGRMSDVAESYGLDLLHVHYAIPHSIAALLAQQMLEKKRRLPFITTLHGTDITLVGGDPSYFGITKFSIERSNGITSISEDLRRHTVETFSVSNDIRVIYNFVNCETYKPG